MEQLPNKKKKHEGGLPVKKVLELLFTAAKTKVKISKNPATNPNRKLRVF